MNSRYVLLSFIVIVSSGMAQQKRYTPIEIPVRDGKVLAADVYTNTDDIQKPVVLVQTPYNKNLYRLTLGLTPLGSGSFPYDSSKYNYVILDWRGFYGSKDAAVTGYDRGLDGYDAVEWIAQQSWCDGKIGTWGPSALGMIQFQTARHKPPHLVCCIPVVKDYKTKYTDYYYGGVFREEHVEAMERLGFLTTSLVKSVPLYNSIWKAIEDANDYLEEMPVPMLLISGWFDHYPDDVIRAFHDLRTRGDSAVRDKHRLIMGPWEHSGVGRRQQGELEFPNGVGVADIEALRFLNYHIYGLENGWQVTPPVRYYQMGDEEWKTADNWYDVAKGEAVLYLGDNGDLGATPPVTAPPSAILYDPRDPSPSYGGARFNPFDPSVKVGPLDIRQIVESRADALVFSTEPLASDLRIAGPVSVVLHIFSNRTDTDFSARLCDVYPDGRSMILTDGIHRARFRNGLEDEEFLTPGAVVPVTIELQNMAWTVKQGHRLRVVVSSSDWPRFDRNLNNGGAMYVVGDTLVATNLIHHTAAYPSHVRIATDAPVTSFSAPQISGLFLEQNFPNPAVGQTTFAFRTGRFGALTLTVSDMLGRLVAMPLNGVRKPGSHQVTLQTGDFTPGMYLVQVRTPEGVAQRLMIVAR